MKERQQIHASREARILCSDESLLLEAASQVIPGYRELLRNANVPSVDVTRNVNNVTLAMTDIGKAPHVIDALNEIIPDILPIKKDNEGVSSKESKKKPRRRHQIMREQEEYLLTNQLPNNNI